MKEMNMSENEKSITGNINAAANAINQAFDATGVTFHDRAAALAAFKEGREVVFEDGQPFALYDREFLPLGDALKRFAYDQRQHVDARTLPRTGVGTSRPGIASKADFPTVAEKIAFVNLHGADAWEKLPLTGIGSKEVVTVADFRRLPLAEKTRLINADPDYLYKLKPSPGLPQPGQARINHEAIERQKAIRPASRRR
jgi:hypothetical protein